MESTYDVCHRINYVLFILTILIIALLIGGWYIYQKYVDLKNKIIDPAQKVVATVSNNVDRLTDVLKQNKIIR